MDYNPARTTLIDSYANMEAAYAARTSEPVYVFIDGREYCCENENVAIDLLMDETELSKTRATHFVNRRGQAYVGPRDDPFGYNGSPTQEVKVLLTTYGRARMIQLHHIKATDHPAFLRTAEGQALRNLLNRSQ